MSALPNDRTVAGSRQALATEVLELCVALYGETSQR